MAAPTRKERQLMKAMANGDLDTILSAPETKNYSELLRFEAELIARHSVKQILASWGISMENILKSAKRRAWQEFSHTGEYGGFVVQLKFNFKEIKNEIVLEGQKCKVLSKVKKTETKEE